VRADVPSVPLARLFALAFRHLIDGLHDRLEDDGWVGIRPSYGFVLLAARDQPIGARALAELLGVTKQAMSQLLEAMEGDGLVARTADPNDGRAKAVTVTTVGHRLLADVEAIYAALEAEWAVSIGADRVEAIRRDITRVLREMYPKGLPPVRPTD
jgi:DNA-binding MarR family transcriptional regulator